MKASKEKQVKVLKTNVKLWNRYIRFCLKINVEFSADLSYAKLISADLRSADLRSADLRYADLRFANLRYANLRFADLSSADLDMSCLPLWCGSLNAKFDLKLRIQIGFHFASLIANCEDVTDEEKQIYNSMLEYVNKFHRTEVERLNSI